ncbi:hypothetical protein [Streptomyces sp. ST2-7A]|uniref:hypothetical protein n=1 Tax=Streptomyces sp. ST2-7A TaxID=2907214 RepID=UPI0035AC24BF
MRFQGTVCGPRGHFPGVFALANELAREGRLSEEEYRFWRAGNDWYNAAYPDPSATHPDLYDHELNPGAVAWFRSTAAHLIDRVVGYRELLAAHGVACERVDSSDPGRIIHEDEVQVVVVPRRVDHPSASARVPRRPRPAAGGGPVPSGTIRRGPG